jgi:hypothetical protein
VFASDEIHGYFFAGQLEGAGVGSWCGGRPTHGGLTTIRRSSARIAVVDHSWAEGWFVDHAEAVGMTTYMSFAFSGGRSARC